MSETKPSIAPRTNTMRLLNQAAETMVNIPSAEWSRWVAYLLEVLEAQTSPKDFNEVLFKVQVCLSQRMCHGEW
jgi:flavin reductase (DIM6/NTAB) family NADH-FMN oxidoreductase RutF